jgi:hypothetical protein
MPRAITLLWQPEGAESTYMLFAWTQFTQLTQEDLIRMMEASLLQSVGDASRPPVLDSARQ